MEDDDLPIGFARGNPNAERVPPPVTRGATYAPRPSAEREHQRQLEDWEAETVRANAPLARVGGWLVVVLVVAFLVDMVSSILMLTPAGWVFGLRRLCAALEILAGGGLLLLIPWALILGYRQNQRRPHEADPSPGRRDSGS